MKTYTRRILFVISNPHLIPHGGIGQFQKSFLEMALDLNWKVDIVTDTQTSFGQFEEFRTNLVNMGATFISAPDTLTYGRHTQTFGFSEAPSLEKMVNFRNGIMEAYKENLYDLIVCNTTEANPVAYILGLDPYCPVVLYTHNEFMIFRNTKNIQTVYSDNSLLFFNKLLEFPGIIIGTHSERNVKELVDAGIPNTVHLGCPMPELELLEPYTGKREGVLFIGRWEDRKGPKDFIRVIKETGLPARVLTNKIGAKKFKAAFEAEGIKNVTYGIELIGQAKVDFIRQSKVHYNPSTRESYCIAFWECLGHMPCIAHKDTPWLDNFEDLPILVDPKDAGKMVKTQYEKMNPKTWYKSPSNLEWVRGVHNGVAGTWTKLVDEFKCKRSKSDAANINAVVKEQKIVSLAEFFRSLGREICVEDVYAVYANRHKYHTIITDSDTYLTVDPKKYVPGTAKKSTPSKQSLEGLFA